MSTGLAISPVVQYWRVLGWKEELWAEFCDQRRSIQEGRQPDDGLVKTARQWGVTVVELQHLILESGLMLEEGERRGKLATKFLAAAEIAGDLLIEKLEDDGERKALYARDAANIAKNMSDASLNLKNGSVAPSITINMHDVKAIIALNKSLPDTFEPVVFEQNEAKEVQESK